MENRSQKSKSNPELNRGLRQMITGMQLRARIPGPQTIVQRPTNRFLSQSYPQPMVRPINRDLYNRWALTSPSLRRPNSLWIRGPPPIVPPEPPEHLRPTPLAQQQTLRFPQYSQPFPCAQTGYHPFRNQRQTNQFLPNYIPRHVPRDPVGRDLYNPWASAPLSRTSSNDSLIRGLPPPPVSPRRKRSPPTESDDRYYRNLGLQSFDGPSVPRALTESQMEAYIQRQRSGDPSVPLRGQQISGGVSFPRTPWRMTTRQKEAIQRQRSGRRSVQSRGQQSSGGSSVPLRRRQLSGGPSEPRLLPRSRREAYIQRERSGGQQNVTSINSRSVPPPIFHILPEDIDIRGPPPSYQPRPNHLLMKRPPPPYHRRAFEVNEKLNKYFILGKK